MADTWREVRAWPERLGDAGVALIVTGRPEKRQRAIDPACHVDSYLRSQKGGPNLDCARPDV
jgi:hypothetical protein